MKQTSSKRFVFKYLFECTLTCSWPGASKIFTSERRWAIEIYESDHILNLFPSFPCVSARFPEIPGSLCASETDERRPITGTMRQPTPARRWLVWAPVTQRTPRGPAVRLADAWRLLTLGSAPRAGRAAAEKLSVCHKCGIHSDSLTARRYITRSHPVRARSRR